MALRDINLIPGEILERRSLIRHLLLWFSSLVVVATILMGVYRYQSSVAYREARNRLGGDENLQAELVRSVSEISREQKALNLALRERLQLGALIDNRLPFSSVLAKLAEIINDETWLQQLAFDTGRDGKFHLIMMGFSSSHATLGMFIQRLSGQPMFRLVVLKSAQESENKLSGTAAVQFQIECDIAGDLP